MLRTDIVRRDLRVFQVDRVKVHANGKCADLAAQQDRRDGAYETGIEAAGKQKAKRRVRIEALFHAEDQLLADGGADSIQIVGQISVHRGQIGIAHELRPVVIVPRRKGENVRT